MRRTAVRALRLRATGVASRLQSSGARAMSTSQQAVAKSKAGNLLGLVSAAAATAWVVTASTGTSQAQPAADGKQGAPAAAASAAPPVDPAAVAALSAALEEAKKAKAAQQKTAPSAAAAPAAAAPAAKSAGSKKLSEMSAEEERAVLVKIAGESEMCPCMFGLMRRPCGQQLLSWFRCNHEVRAAEFELRLRAESRLQALSDADWAKLEAERTKPGRKPWSKEELAKHEGEFYARREREMNEEMAKLDGHKATLAQVCTEYNEAFMQCLTANPEFNEEFNKVLNSKELQDWVNEDVEKTTTADGKKHP